MKTVLFIDDNEELLDMFKNTLPKDVHMLATTNFQKAELLAANNSIDLIVLDYHMPNNDGMKFLYSYGKILPTIIATGDPDGAKEHCQDYSHKVEIVNKLDLRLYIIQHLK